MDVRVCSNGFGRIGRTYLRAALDRAEAGTQDVEVVAINDVTSPATLVQLLEYDSTYSTFGHIRREVLHNGSSIAVDGRRIAVSAERDPASFHWSDYGADVVVESTGRAPVCLRPDAEICEQVVQKVLVRALGLPLHSTDVSVTEGVVTLTGQMERKSETEITVSMTRRIDGVVAVVDKLTWRLDDERLRPDEPALHGVADGRLRKL
jgi:glyceraldehyde-3-phosphate dehydrogenase/erythrose-4-phosphate dehydrogenase